MFFILQKYIHAGAKKRTVYAFYDNKPYPSKKAATKSAAKHLKEDRQQCDYIVVEARSIISRSSAPPVIKEIK